MGGGYWDDVGLPGQPRPAPSAIHHGSPAFLEALGVPILAGRAMTLEETRRGAKVAVLSEDLAKALGGGVGVGRWVVVSGKEYEVIGIARQARYSEMERTPTVAYLPFDYQRPAATVVVRTAVSPMAVLPAVRQAVKEVNRDLPMVDVYTMEQQISRTLQRERLFAWLCGAFGVLALVLCAVGLYGLMAHTTARRTAEIGIRMALGASGGNVMAQVLIEGLRLVAVGLLLGTPLALYAVRIASEQKLLPEGPLPVWTVALAVGVLAVSAVAAILGPAVRASSVEPMQALRRG